MTIILKFPYATYANGATVDLDNATEAALVAQGRASYSGTSPGGVFQPIPPLTQQALQDGVAAITVYTAAQLAALASAGGLILYAQYVASDTGSRYTASSTTSLVPELVVEATAYVTLTATGTAFTGACELAGYYCSVAAGNITVYDNTSATGTPIIPATALATGPFPIFGAGTNGKLVLDTGCHVVLSGAATVRMLVQ